jgi:hypothetical protein
METKILESRVTKYGETWILEYRKVLVNENPIRRFFNNNWYMVIPTYKTREEALLALQKDMKRVKKLNSNVQFIN